MCGPTKKCKKCRQKQKGRGRRMGLGKPKPKQRYKWQLTQKRPWTHICTLKNKKIKKIPVTISLQKPYQ